MASEPSWRLYDPSTDSTLLPTLGQIQADCSMHDGQALSLLPPFTEEKLAAFWQTHVAGITAGTTFMVLAFEASADGSGGSEVAGCVSLKMSSSETGPFRGDVSTLIVSRSHRKKGIARRMMEGLEVEARKRGRTVLTLDTGVGTEAEHVYPRLGYKPVGVIPNYTTNPQTGGLLDEIFFYKNLREE